MRSWRTAHASVIGTSHLASGNPCQDAGRCEVVQAEDGSDILLAAVADGAGSAPCSDTGARMTVDAFLSTFRLLVAENSDLGNLDRQRVEEWLGRTRADLATTAEAEERPLSDYACTFLGAIVGPGRAMFVQVGDGAIVVRDAGADGLSWVFWPQNGEFANTTKQKPLPRVWERARKRTPALRFGGRDGWLEPRLKCG